MAIVYALGCLLCAALNDFLFKLKADQSGSRGPFVTVIGCVLFFTMLVMPINWGENWVATLLAGAISGFFSVVGNILLIEAMQRQSAAMCSTVYRLNMVAVVIGAWVMLDERLTLLQTLGVVWAALAIFFFLPKKSSSPDKPEFSPRVARLGFWMVVIAALLRAGMGLTYKEGFLHGADNNGLLLLNGLFWIIGGVLYSLLREKFRGWKLGTKELGFSALSGVLVTGIVFLMAKALALGNASIVMPIAQMSFLGTLVLSVIFLKEKIDFRKAAGICCGIVAILLLCITF